jgi:hypothetical protein
MVGTTVAAAAEVAEKEWAMEGAAAEAADAAVAAAVARTSQCVIMTKKKTKRKYI